MKSNDKIKDIFSSKLKNFEVDPPQDLWDRIDESLSVQAPVLEPKKVTLRKIIVFASGVAAALVLGFIFFMSDENVAKQLSHDIPLQKHQEIVEETSNVQENIAVISSDRKVVRKTSSSTRLYAGKMQAKQQVLGLRAGDNTPEVDVEVWADTQTVKAEDDQPVGNSSENISKEVLKEKIEAFERAGIDSHNFYLTENEYDDSDLKGISVSLSGRSGLLSSSESRQGPTPSSFLEYIQSDKYGRESVANRRSSSQNEQVNMEHRQPVSFGLKISKGLSRDLSLETGIVYTYLYSDIKPNRKANVKTDGSLKFHYLGVPLNLTYTFSKWGKARFYVSAGGMIEKDVSGQEQGIAYNNTHFQVTSASIRRKVEQDNVQFSATAGFGASYPVVHRLSAYASVGGAYYFDAGNEYRTIYSDKKVQLDLNLGLKYNF